MSPQRTIITVLRTVPSKCWQRGDGLRCEPKVIDLSNWQFAWVMFQLRRKCLIERSWWQGISTRMSMYRLTEKGRAA